MYPNLNKDIFNTKFSCSNLDCKLGKEKIKTPFVVGNNSKIILLPNFSQIIHVGLSSKNNYLQYTWFVNSRLRAKITHFDVT